ncbi:MAG: vanadium-dependent haloperoxidase [Bacteroidetes bacterium]|nr:vanadium-dependent haloperoxidase [Bacteroidota bacterium]
MAQLLKVSVILVLLYSIQSCNNNNYIQKKSVVEAEDFHNWNSYLEDAIVIDFFSPPVAARIYAYANLAAFEVIRVTEPNNSLLNINIPSLDSITYEKPVDIGISMIVAFYLTGSELVYTDKSLSEKINLFRDQCIERGIDKETLINSEKLGSQVADSILMWAAKDRYNEMRSYPDYQLLQTPGSWKPTLPDYSDAMEPHWSKLRSFTLDSASQFRPPPPTKYNMEKNSLFYNELMEVYKAVKNNTSETEPIAKFWDCNPLVRKHQGHVTFAEKKLTPGGHWINIARIAMKKDSFDLSTSVQAYALVTIGIFDAFISCWDAKYSTNYIRPVTVIQEYIDPSWSPIIYTPNFPEYTSGHSVVSGSAATILTHLFGDNYNFTDSTEVPYGMPPRKFNSFYEASDEAAISRLYGGIHFLPAIENGKIQGKKVGKHVLNTLISKK